MTTRSDVRWAYKYYLGREPEDEAVLDFYVEATAGYMEPLQRALFDSAEGKHWVGVPSPHGEFCVWRPGRWRVMVIGNCVGPNLGRALAAMAEVSVYAIDILNFLDKLPMVLAYLSDADIVLAPNLGPEFMEISGERLRSKFGDKLCFYELPYFAGVHPDASYIGERGNRMLSPLGDYHSKIVVKSYLGGLNPKASKEAFTREIENSKEHLEIYKASAAEFCRREERVDVKIASWLFSTIRHRALFYTINHPTAEVLAAIVREVSSRFGFKCHHLEPTITPNDLSRNVTWPVHQSVALTLGLSYSTADVFWMDRYMMDLEEFIWRSFELYRLYDSEQLRAAAVQRGIVP